MDKVEPEFQLPVDYETLHWTERKMVRLQYIREQKGKCAYCKESLAEGPPARITSRYIDWSLFPDGFLNYPIHLQHNHDTGMTEGAVHAYCNAVMWQYEDR